MQKQKKNGTKGESFNTEKSSRQSKISHINFHCIRILSIKKINGLREVKKKKLTGYI